MDPKIISCSIRQDFLKDPATIPCGHTFCMKCIKTHWDQDEDLITCSCPQCSKKFITRPTLEKNTLLTALLEELGGRPSGCYTSTAPAGHCYAGPEDVECDVCTGRKLKAIKFCLVCLVSYCEEHLQPHHHVVPLQKHKLVEPSKKLQENICSRHDEVMKMFCRTDQQLICYLCSLEDHKNHDTVSAAAEKSEKKKDLQVRILNIQQRIQVREEDLRVLQQEVENINRSADESMEGSEKVFIELICLMERRRRDVELQVRCQQKAEVSRVKKLQEKLEQEITELKKKDAEVEEFSSIKDLDQFLHSFSSSSSLSGSKKSSSASTTCPRYFEEVTAAVSKVREKLQDVLIREWKNISQTELDVLVSHPQSNTRAGFSKYFCEITLDPNTANGQLSLSEGNMKVNFTREPQTYLSHPARFTDYVQVLSRESLTGRCYWEVERSGGGVYVAVAYKKIKRVGKSNECFFGYNDNSWLLDCDTKGLWFIHKGTMTPVSGPQTSRVGVFLDHGAGVLSFYSVSGDSITLLHTVHTSFTWPLHAGLGLDYGTSAKLCKLK